MIKELIDRIKQFITEHRRYTKEERVEMIKDVLDLLNK